MRYSILILCLLGAGCREEAPGPDATAERALDPVQLLESDDFWSYRTTAAFTDGGSEALGFINGNGEILHVWFDYSMSMKKDYRPCYLKRSYDDKQAVEIPRQSELESKVMARIETAHCSEQLEALLPSREKAKRSVMAGRRRSS